MGPFTQLLALPNPEVVAERPARRPRRSLPVSGTLLAWSLGTGTAWTAGMVALSLAVRY
jgi:hypothetical protein